MAESYAEGYNTEVIGGIGEKTSNSKTQYFQCRRIYLGNCAITISTTAIPYYIVKMNKELTIRKLTPRECFRLQGVRDPDIDNVIKNQTSDSALYHLSGDSICIDVLMAIFKEML